MPISAAHKASVFSGSNLSSYATGSWTPAANRLAIVSVENEMGTGTPATPTLSGNAITWFQLVTYVPDSTGTQVRITVFVGNTGSSPSAGAITADFGGAVQAGCNIIVDEIDQADVSGTALQAIVQSKIGTVSGSGTSESITLDSAISSGNASYGVFNHQADELTTNGSGYTTLGNGSHAGPASALQTEYQSTGSQTVDASWTTSAGKGGIALEIKAAGGTAAGQAAETDTSQVVGRIKSKAIGQDLETNTPLVIAAQKAHALLQTMETSVAQAITARKVVPLLQAEESDTGQAIGAQRIIPISQVSEIDTGQAIAKEKRVLLLPASQTDTAQAISTVGTVLIQPVEETDLAQSLFPRKRLAIVQPLELELSQAVAARKMKSIALVSEMDLAQAMRARVGPGRSSHAYVTEDRLDYQTEGRRNDETQARKVYSL